MFSRITHKKDKKLYYKLIKNKKYRRVAVYGDIKDDTDENGNEYKKITFVRFNKTTRHSDG